MNTGPTFMLRGIRSTQDYEYERVMRHINADMAPKVCTVFLMPPGIRRSCPPAW